MTNSAAADLIARWKEAWPQALEAWSRFTRLKDPVWCLSQEDENREGLTGSFAMIRLEDHQVVISLRQVQELGLHALPTEVLAHEVGHHVYCPADLFDQARMLARMRKALPTCEKKAGFISNLYADLMINNRLQRSAQLQMATVYQKLAGDGSDSLWTLYMRIYEHLWALPKGTLAKGKITPQLEADAQLGSRLARVYANEWLSGSGSFAMLCLPYLLEDESNHTRHMLKSLGCQGKAGKGDEVPGGLVEIDDDESQTPLHPADDPRINGRTDAGQSSKNPSEEKSQRSAGQFREPFEYGELLKALGLNLDGHEIAVKYYHERALPYLIRFPVKETPKGSEPLPEGTEPWDPGMSIQTLDIFESVLISPQVIPGVTTVQRTYGEIPGSERSRVPLDLDLYVDCSGSMPDPQKQLSYMALAGAIVALSALRAGARVQCTLWSGAGEFDTTPGFTRDENKVLEVLTGYLGGGTAFPLSVFRTTYLEDKKPERPVHILVLSDDGIDTMLQVDEKRRKGADVAAAALKAAQGGGTLALNMAPATAKNAAYQLLQQIGWRLFTIQDISDLVQFARAFSRKLYGNP